MFALALIYIFLYFQSVSINSSVLIGKVNHQLYIPLTSDTNRSLILNFSSNCDECLCYAISSTSISYVVINCLIDTRICYFYSAYESNYTFQWNVSSYLYLFQIPPNRTTVAITTTTSTISTTTSTTSSMTTTITSNIMIISTTSTSTSSTTSTSTSSTTSITTTTTITQCTPQATSSGILFTAQNPTSFSSNYTCNAYSWISTKTYATLSFVFRHDPGYWVLDDVSVYHGTTQIIINGGFETGSLSGWTRTVTGSCSGNYGGQVMRNSSVAKSGNYFYFDGCVSRSDTLYQTFSTIIGDTYIISFWLTNQGCCGSTELANITIT